MKMQDTNNIHVSEHFLLSEFECKCCKQVILNIKLLEKLEILRRKMGEPIIITSGYRCPEYNRKIVGHPFSLHTQGRAVDIKATNKLRLEAHIKNLFPAWYYNPNGNYYHLQLDPTKQW